MILTRRLKDFICNERITVDMIDEAIKNEMPEEPAYKPFLQRIRKIDVGQLGDWDIARTIYFINHPEEIRDISIATYCVDTYEAPIPVIDDGNHRYMAADYLGFEKIHCNYGGRTDLLDYLKGNSDYCPTI